MLPIPKLPTASVPHLRERARTALHAIPESQRGRFRAHVRAALRHRLASPAEVLAALRKQPPHDPTPRSLLLRASARWQERQSALSRADLNSVTTITLESTTDAQAERHRLTLLRGALRRGLVSPGAVVDGIAAAGPHTTPIPRILREAFTAIANGARAAACELARDLGLPAHPPVDLPSWTLERPCDTGPTLLAWPDPHDLLRVSPRIPPRLLAGLACEAAPHPLRALFDRLTQAHRAVCYLSPPRVVDHFVDGYDYFSEMLTDAVAQIPLPTTAKTRRRAIALCVNQLLAIGEIGERDEADHLIPEIERVLDLLDLRALYTGEPPRPTRAQSARLDRLRVPLEGWLATLERAPDATEEVCRDVLYAESRFPVELSGNAEGLQEPWLALLPPSDALLDTVNQHIDDQMNSGYAFGFLAIHRDGEPLLAAVERLTHELALWNVLSYALAEDCE